MIIEVYVLLRRLRRKYFSEHDKQITLGEIKTLAMFRDYVFHTTQGENTIFIDYMNRRVPLKILIRVLSHEIMHLVLLHSLLMIYNFMMLSNVLIVCNQTT